MSHEPMPMRNVLFVAYFFPPRGGPAVQRPAKFAKYLPDFGYKPLVLTAAETEIESVLDRTLLEELRGATIFPCRGYERSIVRLPRKLGLHRLVSFCLLPDRNILAWVPPATQMARRIARRHPINVIYTCVGPFSNALLGLRLKKLLGVPWVVDYRDPWTSGTGTVWATKLHMRFQEHQERCVLQIADAIVVVTPTMKDLLARKYPRCANKIHVIYNGFDQQDFHRIGQQDPFRRQERRESHKLRMGFTGAMLDYDANPAGMKYSFLDKLWVSLFAYQPRPADLSTRSPFYLLHAVRALLDERPELADELAFSFAGRFGERNLRLVRELKLEKVVSAKGYQSHDQAVQVLMDSDVLFLPINSEKDGRRSYNLSGKVFEYFAAEKPILAAVPEGDLRDLIERAGAGWCVEPHDVGAIKSLIEELVEKKAAGTLSINPDRRYIMQFERRELTRQLAALFHSLQPRSHVARE